MDTNSAATPNRRVQKFLDHASSHGWNVGHPDPESHTWLVYPHEDYTEGFVVHDLPNNAARVLRADTYKPVSQKEATAIVEAHHHEQPTIGIRPDLLDAIDIETRIVSSDGEGDVAVLTEFGVPTDLPESDLSEWCQGALLASTKIADWLEKSTAMAIGISGVIDPENYDKAITSPRATAHAYLQLANQLRDPKVLSLVFADFNGEPSKALVTGARSVCLGLVNVWQAFADGLFELGDDLGAPLSDVLANFRQHAEDIRSSAAEKFGDGVTLTDDDLEGLLS